MRVPQLSDLHARPLAQTTFVYAADGSLITTLHAREDRVVLRYAQMPQSIRDAAVAIEDRRFYWHHGFDIQAIVRAAYQDARAGKTVEGGSTITQQLVKNLYVGAADTFRRKVDEAALAWQLEDQLTKQQIITQYLNTVYFGEGAYGVEAAARTYFAEPRPRPHALGIGDAGRSHHRLRTTSTPTSIATLRSGAATWSCA